MSSVHQAALVCSEKSPSSKYSGVFAATHVDDPRPSVQHGRRMKPRFEKPRKKNASIPLEKKSPHFFRNIALVLLSVACMFGAFAPVSQFYLAWFGLVPWLFVVADCRRSKGAFYWSWLAGTLFFAADMWWLGFVSVPGAMALLIFLGLYWAIPAALFHALLPSALDVDRPHPKNSLETSDDIRPPVAHANRSNLLFVILFSMIWTGFEWIRSRFLSGLPWALLGHSQSPFLALCQIADIFGVYGISFCLAATNALFFLLIQRLISDHKNSTGDKTNGPQLKSLLPSIVLVVAIWSAAISYGIHRLSYQTQPGPRVMVIQSNYPQSVDGQKSASEEVRIDYHVNATRSAVSKAHADSQGKSFNHVDMVLWSETEIPILNAEYRNELTNLLPFVKDEDVQSLRETIAFTQAANDIIANLAMQHGTNLIVGASYCRDLDRKVGLFRDMRNAAYLFPPNAEAYGENAPPLPRYDKIHLVPFGEFIPFKDSPWLGWLHRFFLHFSPYSVDHNLTPGDWNLPAVLNIHCQSINQNVRAVAPICYEDVEAPILRQMLNGHTTKRADLIVNLTNDGWFTANENASHLQAAIFRTIESHTPMVRCVNTGISAFIDSTGHVFKTLPAHTDGTATAVIPLDARFTIYTKYGDVFGIACAVGIALRIVLRRIIKRL